MLRIRDSPPSTMAGRGRGQREKSFSNEEVDELLTQLEQGKDWEDVVDAVNEVGGNERDLEKVVLLWFVLKCQTMAKVLENEPLTARDQRVHRIIIRQPWEGYIDLAKGCEEDKGPGGDDPGAAAPALALTAGEEEEEGRRRGGGGGAVVVVGRGGGGRGRGQGGPGGGGEEEEALGGLTKSMSEVSLLEGEDEDLRQIQKWVKTLSTKAFCSLVFSPGFAEAEDKASYLLSSLAVTDQEIQQIERATVGRWKNKLWLAYHQGRIPANYFGFVLTAVKQESYPPFLFKTLLGLYKAEDSEACKWGIVNVPKAKQQYKERTGNHIQERGLFLSKSGLLAASPVGTESDECIVQVKCPWSARSMTVREAAKTIRSFYLKVDKYGSLKLKQTHDYWHQIQGNLHLSKAKSCRLLVWTPHELVTLKVYKDPEWAVNLGILEKFYRKKFLPHVLSALDDVTAK